MGQDPDVVLDASPRHGAKKKREREKVTKTRQLAPTRDREMIADLECVFLRVHAHGVLSRSQPVFVIIMLEKCMNICFINASTYFISFYDIKEKKREKTEVKLRNFPRLAIIPCNIYIYIYILYIYLCIIRYCAHYCSQSLASLPASLVFNLLSLIRNSVRLDACIV